MCKKATIYTYSVIHTASLEFSDKVPFAIAIVENEEKEKFMTFVEGYKEDMKIEIGMELEFSRLNEDGKPIYKFINR